MTIRVFATSVQTNRLLKPAHNQEHTRFVNYEIKRLLEADIIEPARSLWKAQALVVNQERKD